MQEIWKKIGNIFPYERSQVPVALNLDDNNWRIFFSDRDGKKSIPKSIILDSRDITVVSEPTSQLLDCGGRGTFDWAGVMPTEVLKVGDEIFLYYVGWSNRIDVPYHNSLGLAISKDKGASFQKFSDGPIFSTSANEPGYIGTISIIVEEQFRGWYLSCRRWEEHDGVMEPYYDIKYATSKDGIFWEPQNITCIELREGEGGISQASVQKLGGFYHMWFSYRMESDFRTNPERTYKIGYAYSNDGIHWNRIPEPDLTHSSNRNEWDGLMAAYPYIIRHGDSLIMLYNGNGFGETGIGAATADIEEIIQRVSNIASRTL